MMFEAYPDILTTKDLQRIFPKNRNAIYDLLKSGELPSFKLGREYMILKSIYWTSSRAGWERGWYPDMAFGIIQTGFLDFVKYKLPV